MRDVAFYLSRLKTHEWVAKQSVSLTDLAGLHDPRRRSGHRRRLSALWQSEIRTADDLLAANPSRLAQMLASFEVFSSLSRDGIEKQIADWQSEIRRLRDARDQVSALT